MNHDDVETDEFYCPNCYLHESDCRCKICNRCQNYVFELNNRRECEDCEEVQNWIEEPT
jgi:hypothetical protein